MLTQAHAYTPSFPSSPIPLLTLHVHFHISGLGAALQPTDAVEAQGIPGDVYKVEGEEEAKFR